jgi:hypothetical protein
MPRVSRAAATLVAAALSCNAATHAAAAETACVRELAHTETNLVKTLVRLRGVSEANGDARCAVYQEHVAVVTKARDVFSRCKTGPDRETDVHQLDGALSDANSVIAQTCRDH